MKILECSRCGSKELLEVDRYFVCTFCQSKFVPQAAERPPVRTTIELETDIERLLRQCREDPANQARYASLILDIDPLNKEALQYLR